MPASEQEMSCGRGPHEDLIRSLKQMLPPESLLTDAEDMRPFECDGLSVYRRLPMVVVLPDTVDQIQSILRLCHTLQVPVVARGAGTGLSGGALPLSNGVLLSLAKFKRILNIDPENAMATLQPGVRNLAISDAVAKYGLYYAPDPSSQIACTIGGNVAENSGGVHCLKYGLTVHNILMLKVVTMEGELLTIGAETLDAPGYDLLALMSGSEGMLAVIVEVTVKLLPRPERAQVLLAAFDDVYKAGEGVGAVIAAGIIPAGLEMMDKLAIQAAEDFAHAGYPRDAEAILLCELDGTNAEVSEHILAVRKILQQSGATEVRTAASEAERQLFWKGRKSAFPAVGRISPDYYCMDGTIPRRQLPRVLRQISLWAEEYGLPVANVFHAGDGNLHPLILFDANRDGELARTEEFGQRILELCVEVGGSITGEHGVGVEKINQMCTQFKADELEQFHSVKSAFDPDWLLNPGKAVPTLQRCAEFGAMHVHHGQLPHPELERF
ncbi:glycolate dehydrogenase, putative FAD-linked subunit [Candidatus Nitrotoga fabula]|uniref:Glycolate dehydrogenase, putative FAD-linked subunit n=2 Tax=Candidatus Nitrotoga fabula TaxID=2182327 RepID=A0A916BFR7_9PROT|nr:FAD-linked oxidase C-terminal domain-containing protein [Candidatus Nitrotoga fabula]CAE6728384.1 glycolate dehydrogenase, putative FAD-linked subunit [Candidatus Nitrotoga fabula]